MKRIILTESQYKRLVKKPLNEQNVIFDSGYDWEDVKTFQMINILGSLTDSIFSNFNENLYVKSIDGDKVVIDFEKYDEINRDEIKKYIIDEFNREVTFTDNPDDNMDDEGNIDFSFDSEPIDDEEKESEFVGVELDEVPDGSFTSGIPKKLHPVMYLISASESGHDYTKQEGGATFAGLTDNTIEFAMTKGGRAIGRWQLMPKYMEKRVKQVGLKMTDKFSKVNQDKIAMHIIKGWENLDCKKLAQKLARIWAGVPILYDQHVKDKYGERDIKRGDSYFDGVTSNDASISADKFETAVRKSGCGGGTNYSNDTMGFPRGGVNSRLAMVGGKGGNWGGSMPRALSIAKIIKDEFKVSPSSQKRTTEKTADDMESHHYYKNLDSYAVDLPTGTTKENLPKDNDGDKMFKMIVKHLGKPNATSGKWLNIYYDGYRYNIGWRVSDHYDHIHVGVTKK